MNIYKISINNRVNLSCFVKAENEIEATLLGVKNLKEKVSKEYVMEIGLLISVNKLVEFSEIINL